LPRSEAASNRCVDAPNSGVETHELVRQDHAESFEIELVVGGSSSMSEITGTWGKANCPLCAAKWSCHGNGCTMLRKMAQENHT
jgi:hypothetical protein